MEALVFTVLTDRGVRRSPFAKLERAKGMSPLKSFRVLLTAGVFAAAGSPFLPSAVRAQDDGTVEPTEFAAQASALPFSPDAREVEFEAAFGDIEYTSGSPLGSLEDFYRREMKKRGWTEDESAATGDDESANMTFEVGSARVEIELDADSDGEVTVSMDCEGLDFDGTDDPAALLAAGVPQPRTYVFLQNEIPRPDEFQEVQYSDHSCHFKSPLALQAAFDFYGKSLKGLGWRESRKPIVTDDRRYTEFKKGAVTVSVNIFEHEAGSRIILGYENPAKEKVGPPLPVVASSRPNQPGVEPDVEELREVETIAKVAVDVSTNKGSATVTQGKDKYVFKHAAAFQTREGGDTKTNVVFSDRPIPLQKMQAMLATKEDFRFGDLFEFDSPGQLTVEIGGYLGFMFNAGGTGIGDSLAEGDTDMKVEDGRLRGAIKMVEPKEVFDEPFEIAATVDVAVLTPNTRLGGGAAAEPAVSARQAPFADSELLLPEGAANAQSSGSQYTTTSQAEVDLSLKAVAEFYRRELTAQGYKEARATAGDTASDVTLIFEKPDGTLSVHLTGGQEHTKLHVTLLNDAQAKRDGILPEPGKGRLVMVNGHSETIVVLIGKQSYTLKAGRGTEDPKQAWNYSVSPGKYDVTIKIPGKAPQKEKLAIEVGTTWGLFAMPTGEYFTNQLYGETQ